jgi:hypothetical protein
MLKISIVDSNKDRRLILEGKLIAPWTTELTIACERAKENLDSRVLVIDLRNVMVISQEGEELLAGLMNEGVKFRCCGVFARHVLRRLALRARNQLNHI